MKTTVINLAVGESVLGGRAMAQCDETRRYGPMETLGLLGSGLTCCEAFNLYGWSIDVCMWPSTRCIMSLCEVPLG